MIHKPTRFETLKLAIILAVTLTLWSSAFVAIPIAVQDYSPQHSAVFRQMITLALILPFLLMRWRSSVVPTVRRDWKWLLLMAFVGVALYQFTLNSGQRTMGAGSASLITNLSPVVSAILAALFLKEQLSARLLIGGMVSFLGVVVLILGGSGSLAFDFNALWVLLAMSSQAIYFVVQRQLNLRNNSSTVVAIGLAVGSILLLPWAGGLGDAIRGASLTSTLAVLYLGVVMIIPFVGWAYVLSRVEVSKAVLWLYLVPPLATLLGWAILGDRPTPAFLAAGAIILAGLAIAQMRRWPRRQRLVAESKSVCPEAAE